MKLSMTKFGLNLTLSPSSLARKECQSTSCDGISGFENVAEHQDVKGRWAGVDPRRIKPKKMCFSASLPWGVLCGHSLETDTHKYAPHTLQNMLNLKL